MAQAVGVQLHCGFLSLLLGQATAEFLMNTCGSPGTCFGQDITLICSCQKTASLSFPCEQCVKEEQTTRFVFEETPIAYSHTGTVEDEAPQSSIAW
jgi:hypothetical protein